MTRGRGERRCTPVTSVRMFHFIFTDLGIRTSYDGLCAPIRVQSYCCVP